MRILVLSCIVCSRDSPQPVPLSFRHDADYILLTDRKYDPGTLAGWEQRKICPLHVDPVRTVRYYKWLIQDLFPGYSWYIWIDASCTLLVPPEAITHAVGDCDVGLFRHQARICVYQEGLACVYYQKDDPNTIYEHIRRLRISGYPECAGLHECTFVVSRGCQACRAFLSDVHSMVVAGSRRDQLSFDPVRYKSRIACTDFPGNILHNDLVRFSKHVSDVVSEQDNTRWVSAHQNGGFLDWDAQASNIRSR